MWRFWKPVVYTIIIEACLYGVGLVAVPNLLEDYLHIWLPIAFAALLIMICRENWPRWMNWAKGVRWVDIETAGRLFRDEIENWGAGDLMFLFDELARPNNTGSAGRAFKSWLVDGLNDGSIEVRGMPINGSKRVRLDPSIHGEFEDERHTGGFRAETDPPDTIFANGFAYHNLMISKSDVRSIVERYKNDHAKWRAQAQED